MKLAKVKVIEGHTAKEHQLTKDGYLGQGGEVILYEPRRARKKAMLFGGVVESVPSLEYEKETIIRIRKEIIPDTIYRFLIQLKVFEDTDKTCGEFLVYSSSFSEILELQKNHLTPTEKEFLLKMIAISANSLYVHILKV